MEDFIVGSYHFRPKEMKATEVLALESVLDFNSVERAEYMFNAILERVEVEIAGVWQPVKRKGSDELTPVGLENDLQTLHTVCMKFMKQVIEPVFKKSEELKKSQ